MQLRANHRAPFEKGGPGDFSVIAPILIRSVFCTASVNNTTVRRPAVMKGYMYGKIYQGLCAKSNNYQEENLDLKNTAMVFIGVP